MYEYYYSRVAVCMVKKAQVWLQLWAQPNLEVWNTSEQSEEMQPQTSKYPSKQYKVKRGIYLSPNIKHN